MAKRNTITATIDVDHVKDMLRSARTENGHVFFSDERVFGGHDTAPEPLQYFTAATGF